MDAMRVGSKSQAAIIAGVLAFAPMQALAAHAGEDAASQPIEIEGQFLASVYFTANSTELVGSAQELLDTLASIFNADPTYNEIVVEGHDGMGSDAATHPQVSEQRARNVANYLASKGVDAKRIKLYWRGATEPVTSGSSALNQRVEIYVR